VRLASVQYPHAGACYAGVPLQRRRTSGGVPSVRYIVMSGVKPLPSGIAAVMRSL